MTKIITVTINTAIDHILEVDELIPGGVIRAEASERHPSGKGINVARVIATLGQSVTALGFAGRNSRSLFKELESPSVHVNLTCVSQDTRTNVSIIDRSRNTTTHLVSPGFEIAEKDLSRLEELLAGYAERDDLVICSGSVPDGAPFWTYSRLIEQCHRLGARVILDSSGRHLQSGVQAKPFMIKPNFEEFVELLGPEKSLYSEAEILDAIKWLAASGIELVILSMGADGIIVFRRNDNRMLKASISLHEPLISAGGVGSGDALVGGFACGLIEQRDFEDVIRLAVACGTANLLTKGPAFLRDEDVKRFIPLVTIQEL